ncbi:DHH family phosphoesterase [Candidatus Micrarchaeota archaeon]|nr:DHH family phosphoesterase [Candidatus Micrarchaeota archaeon]
MSEFQSFLSKYSGSKIAIVTHNKADVDAISSAYAVSTALPNSIICSSGEMRQGARMLCERLKIKVHELNDLKKEDYEGIVVVDTSTYVLTPEAKGWRILLILDHHQNSGKDMNGELEIIDPESPSTAEMCGNLISGIRKDVAFGLCIGIIADAARFKAARAATFETLGKLMKLCNGNYGEMLGYAEPEPTLEAKLAMMNCMKKTEYVYAAGHVIATSEATGNESDAASLITEAADVAFIAKWNDREQETRISARARPSVKVSLSDVMKEAGEALGGAGGGHAKAAGAALKVHTDEALKKCVEIFISKA